MASSAGTRSSPNKRKVREIEFVHEHSDSDSDSDISSVSSRVINDQQEDDEGDDIGESVSEGEESVASDLSSLFQNFDEVVNGQIAPDTKKGMKIN